MGLAIEKEQFTPNDYKIFSKKLKENLSVLKELLNDPKFGVGDTTIGGEIEYSIVDSNLKPLMANTKILSHDENNNDEKIQVELNKFNLEYNLDPVLAKGNSFTKLANEAQDGQKLLNKLAAKYNGQVLPVGILPTITRDDLAENNMTNYARFRALSNAVKSLRSGLFKININGQESLKFDCPELTLEGANTSFQIQQRVNPNEFADYFNAAQLATPFALAISANSPIFLEKILWDETRVALFKQSIETRKDETNTDWRRPNRVSFGYGWVREGAYELFAENAALMPPVLPIIQSSSTSNKDNGPDLYELRLHQGSIWHWNRVIYDSALGGHIRVEFRALPSGPSITDMQANAAFLLGLTKGLTKNIKDFLPGFPFMFAEYNFYRAAQHGLNAKLLWPSKSSSIPRAHNIKKLLTNMIPIAKEGLLELQVDQKEVNSLIEIIQNRLNSEQNGANWQKSMVKLYQNKDKLNRHEAIFAMLKQYQANNLKNIPVAEWDHKL